MIRYAVVDIQTFWTQFSIFCNTKAADKSRYLNVKRSVSRWLIFFKCKGRMSYLTKQKTKTEKNRFISTSSSWEISDKIVVNQLLSNFRWKSKLPSVCKVLTRQQSPRRYRSLHNIVTDLLIYIYLHFQLLFS